MQIGLEVLLEDPKGWLQEGRVGLIANPSTVDSKFNHAIDLLHAHKAVNLVRLFGPEHGIRGAAQYMVAVAEAKDPSTGLPEMSLYGSTFDSLAPTEEQLAGLDLLLFDIQDVGSRYYTYAATMALCMRQAAKHDVRVVVLDRPNPIGGTQVEGGGLEAGLENFCALYPVPHRHGMTVGELANLYNVGFGIGCELEVVPCKGWKRAQYFDETTAPWTMPSPNMPTVDTAIVYPGMCLLEGTNISEGRGTTRPFELFGAPFIDGYALRDELSRYDLDGVVMRPCAFEPTFDKFTGENCCGLQLHVTDRQTFASYRTGLAIIAAIKKLWPKEFAWRTEPYEFRDDVPAIDLLTGIPAVRTAIDAEDSFGAICSLAFRGTQTYDSQRGAALLYA